MILGLAAPSRGSLEELRAAWRLLRAALVAVAAPLYSLSEFDAGLLRVDNVLGPTAACTRIDPLKRVAESWESACVDFRRAGAGVTSLACCVPEHDQYLIWKSTTATVREEHRTEFRPQSAKPDQRRRRGKGVADATRGRSRGAHGSQLRPSKPGGD